MSHAFPREHTRILFSANAAPNVGGQGLNLLHVVNALAPGKSGHVFCRAEFPHLPTTIIRPTPVDRLLPRIPYVRRLRDWGGLISDVGFDTTVSAHLLRLRARDDFRRTILHGAAGQTTYSLATARRRGWRTMLDVVNTHIDDLAEQVERECRRFGIRSFIRPAMRRRVLREYAIADVIRVMSARARATFEARGFDVSKVLVATPPVDVDAFEQARFDEPVFRVAFVGLLEPWKGFHYLVEAFRALNIADAELVFWGGPGSRPVSKFIQESMRKDRRIRLRPESVQAIAYRDVYSKASVVVHPSMTDGFGYVVSEAMASGVPVIVSTNAGAADLVRDGENGYVVPAGDAAAIESRLRHLAQNPSLLAKMGAEARKTARSLTPEAFRNAYKPAVERLE